MRARPTPTQPSDERGAVLLLALVFIGIIALVISALLAQSAAQFRAARAFSERRDGIYAADAGLEHAVAGVGMLPGDAGDPGTCDLADTIAFHQSDFQVSTDSTGPFQFPLNDFNVDTGAGTNRIVIAAFTHVGTRALTTVTFDGRPMTFANRQTADDSSSARDNTTEVWYILDANLPAAAGSTYDILATLNGSGSATLAIQASSFTGVRQVAPNPTTNGSTKNSGTERFMRTTLSAPTGSLLYSAAGTSRVGVAQGSGAGTRLLGTSSTHAPANAAFGTSFRIAGAGDSGTVQEDFNSFMQRGTHVVLDVQRGSAAGSCPSTPTADNHEESVVSGFSFLSEPVTVSMGGYTLVASTGFNRLLIVATNMNSGGRVQSVRFAGVAMHAAGRAENGTSSTALWYLLDAELPGAGDHTIDVTGTGCFFCTRNFAIHASSWTGVLQSISGSPVGPSDQAQHTLGSATAITTAIDTDAPNALVLSAAGHNNSGAGGMGGTTGTARLTSGPAESGASFGTSFQVVPAATAGYQVTESFNGAGNPTTHALAAFRPASWAPLAYGAACEDGLSGYAYNGYVVEVTCDVTGNDAVTIVSTATDADTGRVSVARAVVTRLPSGSIEITEWDTRPDAQVLP